jgi:hypothetical protein
VQASPIAQAARIVRDGPTAPKGRIAQAEGLALIVPAGPIATIAQGAPSAASARNFRVARHAASGRPRRNRGAGLAPLGGRIAAIVPNALADRIAPVARTDPIAPRPVAAATGRTGPAVPSSPPVPIAVAGTPHLPALMIAHDPIVATGQTALPARIEAAGLTDRSALPAQEQANDLRGRTALVRPNALTGSIGSVALIARHAAIALLPTVLALAPTGITLPAVSAVAHVPTELKAAPVVSPPRARLVCRAASRAIPMRRRPSRARRRMRAIASPSCSPAPAWPRAATSSG